MTESPKTDASKLPNYFWIAAGIITIAAYLCGLWLPLVGPDEPRYAQVAREMFERGDWITPTLGGHTWFEKPALLYWLEIGGFFLFGVNEFAVRIGSALFGLGTVVALWRMGKWIESERPEMAQFANWIALIGASTLGILVFAHGASFDIIITFPMTAAMVSFFIYDRGRGTLPLIALYFFIGLALLAKGLIGIVLPFGIIAVYFVLSRRLPDGKLVFSTLWGTPLSLAVAGIWYVPVYLQNGWPFVDEFLIQHHFQRFTSNKYQHPQPFYFYLWVLPLMTLPWFPFVVAGGYRAFTRTIRDRVEPLRALSLLAIASIAVPVLFFSLSGSKLPGYIVPAVPPAVVLAALFVSGAQKRVWGITTAAIALVTLIGTVVLTFTVVPKFARGESVKPLIEASDAHSHSDKRIFALSCIPHGTEFYAPERILRGPDGEQKKLYSGHELKFEMERAGVRDALVIVPAVYPDDLTVHKDYFRYEKIGENNELAIYAVELLRGTTNPVH